MSLNRKQFKFKQDHIRNLNDKTDWRFKLNKEQEKRNPLDKTRHKPKKKRVLPDNSNNEKEDQASAIATGLIIITSIVLLGAIAGALALLTAGTGVQIRGQVNTPMVPNNNTSQHHANVTRNNNGTAIHHRATSGRNATFHHQRPTHFHNRSKGQPRLVKHRNHRSTHPKPVSSRRDVVKADTNKHQVSKQGLFSFAENSSPSPVSLTTSKLNQHENKDLHYSLSDCKYNDMYRGECRVVQLTRNNIGETKILDFWGEGRILESDIITGFTDSYNVNYQHQKVSNGKNSGKNIPNRIPTQSYQMVEIPDLVANDTFQYVTTMGSLIIPESAREMYRMVRKDDNARILFYGTETTFIDRIQNASQKDFIFMHHSTQYADSLEPQLQEPTVRPINTMVPIRLVLRDLNDALMNNDVTTSAKLLIDLSEYCRSNYMQTSSIRQQVRFMWQNQGMSSFANEVYEHISSTDAAHTVLEQFDIEPKKMNYGR